MKLYVLGSGTCVPYQRRGSSGYALELPNSTILLDCGNGTTWKLGRVGINYLEVDHIFISHFHPDHTADLIPFLFATRYAYGSPYGESRKKRLNVWGSGGFKDFFSGLRQAYGRWIVPEELSIEEIDEGALLKFADFTVASISTPHIESSFAYRIRSNGKTLVYSGDTDYSVELIHLAKEADALIIECAIPDEQSKIEGHLTPEEVVTIVNESGVNKAIITHLYPECDENKVGDKIAKQVKAEVIVAEDLLEIEI